MTEIVGTLSLCPAYDISAGAPAARTMAHPNPL